MKEKFSITIEVSTNGDTYKTKTTEYTDIEYSGAELRSRIDTMSELCRERIKSFINADRYTETF